MKRIYYTGIGARPGYLHTSLQFVRVMRRLTDGTDDADMFRNFQLDDWILWSGARIVVLGSKK